jgi:TRAP-type C4-dicarboxylate transport system permease small subunit
MISGEPATQAGYARRALNVVDWIVAALVILAMAAMVTLVTVQVGLRYGLNQSIDWADEVSRLLFVWSIFLAIPLGIRRGAHVNIALLTSWLPAGARRGLFRLCSLLAMALMGVVAWQTGLLIRDQWDEPMATLDISAGLFMVPVLVCAAHSMLHLLAGVIEGRSGQALPAAQ